jgi:hypothetical protein
MAANLEVFVSEGVRPEENLGEWCHRLSAEEATSRFRYTGISYPPVFFVGVLTHV